MLLEFENLTVRDAGIKDAKILTEWWNDGSVMSDLGFPNGLGKTVQKVESQIKQNDINLLILEFNGKLIGEADYKECDDKTVAIDIKICDLSMQNKGLGKKYLSMLIFALFFELGYEKIILDTNLSNERAQHVYEQLGFRRIGVRENCWRNQVGELLSAVDYELTLKDFKDYTKQYK